MCVCFHVRVLVCMYMPICVGVGAVCVMGCGFVCVQVSDCRHTRGDVFVCVFTSVFANGKTQICVQASYIHVHSTL